MEPEESRLILEGAGGRFIIGVDFWNEIVDWASQKGWLSDYSSRFDGSAEPRDVSAEDAARLAEALDIIGGDLIIQSHTNVSEEFITELANALLTLQHFAESGGFRVSPAQD